MTREEITEVVLRALCEIAPEADPVTLEPAVGLRDQLDIDSMDFLSFAVVLHRELGVEIPEADYGRLATLDDAVDYLAAAVDPD